MRFDLHVHVLPSDPALVPVRGHSVLMRIALYRASRAGPSAQDAVADLVAASQVDRAVVLAIDAAHDDDGLPDPSGTRLFVSNDEVADLCARRPRLLFGASVHPYRPDALAELDRVAARGACLVKWIPSAQNIAPDDPRCVPFYERLADLGIPLLSHTGIEHTLRNKSDDLNHPRRLRPALERGVTVIAGHCGTRLYLHERSQFPAWCRLARDFERCYGETGAFGLPMHGGPIAQMVKDDLLRDRVLFGSDFPALVWPTWYADRIGWRRARDLAALPNPFDRMIDLLRTLGLPQTAFTRAGELLRLPRTEVP